MADVVCAGRTLPSFKAKAKELDLSVAALENIVHEYINQPGNENKFPGDDYILKAITPKSETFTKGKEQTYNILHQLWEATSALDFSAKTYAEAEAIVKRTFSVFSKESIKIIQRHDGNFEVKVAEPKLVSEEESSKTLGEDADIIDDDASIDNKDAEIGEDVIKPVNISSLFGESPATSSNKETEKKAKDPQKEAFDNFIAKQTLLNNRIKFVEKGHLYYLDGSETPTDFSTTGFKDFLDGKKKQDLDENDFTSYYGISTRLGTTHDEVLRDYFMGKLKKSYPNLTAGHLKALVDQAKKLEEFIKNALECEHPIFITDEKYLRLAAKVNHKGKEWSIAGTMDMVVIDDKGGVHVIDFKTRRANNTKEISDSDRAKYAFQTAMYQEMLSQSIGKKVEDTYLAQFNVFYPGPSEGKYTAEGLQLSINGHKIQEYASNIYKQGKFHKLIGVSMSLSDYPFTIETLKSGFQQKAEAKKVKTTTSTSKPIDVISFSKKYGVLGTYGDKPFSITVKRKDKEGKEVEKVLEFPTVEHYIGYRKASVAAQNAPKGEQQEYYKKAGYIRKAVSPQQAKYYADNISMTPALKKAWSEHRVNAIKRGLKLAFEANPKAKELLLSTGSAEIINSQRNADPEVARILMELRGEFGGTGVTKTVSAEQKAVEEATATVESSGKAATDNEVLKALQIQNEALQAQNKLMMQMLDELKGKKTTTTEVNGTEIKEVEKSTESKEEKSEEKKKAKEEAIKKKEEELKEAKEKADTALAAMVKKQNSQEATKNEGKPLEEFQDDFFSLSQKAEPSSSFLAEYTLSLKEQQKIPRVNRQGEVTGKTYYDITDRDSKENPKRVALNALIQDSLVYSSALTVDGPINPNMFFTIDVLLNSDQVFEDGYTKTIIFDEDDALVEFATAYAKGNEKFPYNPKTREFKIPKFTVGYKRQDIEKRIKMNKLLDNNILKVDEIRGLAKATIYQASEIITMINTVKNGYEHFFKTDEDSWTKDPNKDKDFTQMSRIDVIKTIGIGNILNLVRDRVFSIEGMTDDEKKKVPFKKLKKMNLIRSNWEAFRELGYDTLINVEEIALSDKDNVKSDNDTVWDDKTEDEIQEMFGSSIEHWQVGFRQVSTFSSLSKLIKNTMDSLYQVDDEGNVISDEFGLGKHLSAQEAVSKILHYTQGARNIDQMIELLKEASNQEKWLPQVIKLLEGEFNEAGEMVKAPNEQFRTQFFNNFKKYFQKYAITFKEGKGKKAVTKVKVINQNQYKDTMIDDCQALENSFAEGVFPLKNKDGSINKENLEKLTALSKKLNEYRKKLGEGGKVHELIDDLNEYHKTIKETFDLLGIETPEEESLQRIFGKKVTAKTFADKVKYLLDYINNAKQTPTITSNKDYKDIVGIAAKEMGLEMESVSYEGGKMYYSYTLPNYLGNLIGKLKQDNMSDEEYAEFLEKEYGRYKWFKKDGEWRNYWLELLSKSSATAEKGIKANMEHVTSLHYMDTSYADKTPAEYIASMMRMYFFDDNREWAYFRVPMMSNKPSEEYIKFKRISNGKGTADYQGFILNKMTKVFYQELDRIQAVRERNGFCEDIDSIREDQKIKSKGKKPTFDKNGLQFKFEDYLPVVSKESGDTHRFQSTLSKDDADYEDSVEFAELIEKHLREENGNEGKDDSRLLQLYTKFAKRGIQEQYQNAKQQWINEGFLTYEEKEDKEGKVTTTMKVFGGAKYTEEDLEEFYWNDYFASVNILQLTITDTAYYVDTEDLQKRLAQLHAPGTRADINATYLGEKYTADGIERTIYLEDDIIKSEIIPNLHKAFDNMRVEASTQKDKDALTAIEKGIMGAFEGVNVADAQGYNSPTSYRKKMGVFGKWNKKMEDAYQKVLHPEEYPDANLADMLTELWQPLKPFVYTQVGVDGLNQTLPDLKVGIQNKNSEYVLILADAIMRRAGNRANKLSAIYRFMEESQLGPDGKPNGKGIDTIQFMSAVNAGCHGVLNINFSQERLDAINDKYGVKAKNPAKLEDALTKKGIPRKEIVQAIEDVRLTEDEVYSTLHNAAYGMDGKYNLDYVHEIPFEDYMIQQEVPAHFRGHSQAHGSQVRILTFADVMDTDEDGGNNYLTINGKNITVAKAKEQYFEAIKENIEDSLKEITERFNLDSEDERAKNVALSKVLKDTILKDSRFGSDLLWACDTNEYGQFNIPLSDPIQSNRIQQLLNSIIKNTINKQEIAGGPVVQVSEFGTSDSLHIRYNSADGILLTQDEFENDIFPDDYSDFTVNDDGEKVMKFAQKKEGQTYEDYIKNQEGVAYFECYVPIQDMNIAKDFTIKNPDGTETIDVKAMEKINPKFLEMVGYRIPTESKYSMVPIKVKGFLPAASEGIMMPAEITSLAGSDFDIDKLYIMRHQLIRDKDGKWKEPDVDTRAYRDNLIISTQLAVLQSEQVMKQLFTPGNFDQPKKYGYLVAYVKNEAAKGRDPKEVWDEAMKKEAELGPEDFQDWVKDKNKTSSNLCFNQTQVQFHKQNMTAGKLIGIFAQANVSHAFISLKDNTRLFIPEECNFVVDNVNVSNGIDGKGFIIDDNKTIDGSVLISNNLAAYLAASVDAVKDPILNLMNINTDTANMVTSLIRMGLSIEQVSLLSSQPALVELIKDYAMRNAEGRVSMATVIEEHLERYAVNANDEEGKSDVEGLEINVTTDDLVANLNGNNRITNYKVVSIFQKMQVINDTFNDITHMTRYNSITSAVGPFAIDTMIQRIKVKSFEGNNMISNAIREACNNPILSAFRDSANEVEKKLLGKNMIQASDHMDTAMKQCAKAMGYTKGLPSKLTGAFSDFYMSYFMQCSAKGSLYDLSKEHREEMVRDFPEYFKVYKQMHPDNIFLNSIQVVKKRNDDYPTLQLKTRGMSSETLEDLKQGWAALVMSNKAEDVALSLALVEYNFFKGGFGFSPKTFMNLVPNAVKMRIPNYIATLNAGTNDLTDTDGNSEPLTQRMIKQFILHHPEYIPFKGSSLKDFSPEEIDDTLTINKKPNNKKSKKKRRAIEAHTGSLIKIGNEIYLVKDQTKETMSLEKIDHLGGQGQGFEISLTEDYPKSIYNQELSKRKSNSRSNVGGQKVSMEDMGVIIDDLLNDQELKYIFDKPCEEFLEYLNSVGAEQGIKLFTGMSNQNTILAIRKALTNVNETEWREILNGVKKTIKDLDLCNGK